MKILTWLLTVTMIGYMVGLIFYIFRVSLKNSNEDSSKERVRQHNLIYPILRFLGFVIVVEVLLIIVTLFVTVIS